MNATVAFGLVSKFLGHFQHPGSPSAESLTRCEGDRVEDGPWFAQILREYKRCGFLTAIDDFGAGYAGLALLADFQPDLIKIDMGLIRGVDSSIPRQAIVRGLMRVCEDLGVRVIAEGIETAGERDFLFDAGVRLMQGYLFCRPVFQGVGQPDSSAWDGASHESPCQRRPLR